MPISKANREREFAEFVVGFRMSARGNLSRQYDGNTITVFKHRGKYVWCIRNSEEDETTYSTDQYDTENDAMMALADQLCLFCL